LPPALTLSLFLDLKMEAIHSSEMSVDFQLTRRRYISEEQIVDYPFARYNKINKKSNNKLIGTRNKQIHPGKKSTSSKIY
jgi:hypothetical protein